MRHPSLEPSCDLIVKVTFVYLLFSRLVKNYFISEGSVVACTDVLEHSEKERESLEIAVPLMSHTLTLVVRDTWGEKVKKVKRGPRNNQKLALLNVAHKQNQARDLHPDLNQEFKELVQDNSLILPKGWFKIVDRQNRVSFVRPETWEFDNQRIYTEIVIELSMEQSVTYLIKSHGSELNLNHLNIEKVMQDLPIKTQAETIIKAAENLKMCSGYRLSGDGAIIAMTPHRAGIFRSLSNNEILPQTGAFSSKCQLFHYAGGQCFKCCQLGKADNQRKKRRETRQSIPSHCNKRYLTKEEIQLQLKEEKKVKKKFLEEKGKGESSESEDDDSVSQNESDSDED